MYSIAVLPQFERIDQIKNKISGSNKTHRFFEYQNTLNELHLIRIPLSLPIYRMANWRTRTRQQHYIRIEEKSSDFFSSGQENEDAQQAQHEILVEFAKQGKAVSITPIIDVLENDVQKEPLLITYDGVVVNGNRRLAGMRYLYETKNRKEFEYIECVVLPENATEEEIKDIEIRLQMQPHTELPYEWVIGAMAATEILQNKGMKAVTELMRISSTSVTNKVLSLELVNDYLNRWVKDPENYELVEDKEQWFSDLAKIIRKKSSSDEKEAATVIAHLLAENKSLLGGRIYNLNSIVGNLLPDVAGKLAKQKNIKLETVNDDPDSLFGNDLEPIFSYQPLVDVVEQIHNSGNKENIITLVKDIQTIYEDVKEKDDDKTKGEYAQSKIVQANTALRSVNLTEADPSTYKTIKKQLEQISQQINKLDSELEILMNV
ncbi:MAG: hypothetical protein AB7D34_02255 [Sulfurimonas sp.]